MSDNEPEGRPASAASPAAIPPASGGAARAAGPGGRPPRSYTTGPVTRVLRLLTVLLTSVAIVVTLALYSTLPDTIPTHFGISGQPDAWGPRGSILGLLAIFAALVGGMTWLSHHPRVFNYPGIVTEYNAQAMYRAGEQLMVWTTASCAVIFAGIMASTLWAFNASTLVIPGLIGIGVALAAGLTRIVRA